MEDLRLKATQRMMLGKKTRFLRRQGITPAHLYGHGIEPLALQCNTDELANLVAHAGKTRLVSLEVDGEKEPKTTFVREIQCDALTRQLLHVDFLEIKRTEKIAVEVPIVLVGEAPALKTKGRMLFHGLNSLSIECLPANVPPQIDIDISGLEEVEQAIHVKDIVLDPAIAVHADPEQLVVKISEVMVREVEEPAEAGEAVTEVAKAGAEAEAPAEKGASGEER